MLAVVGAQLSLAMCEHALDQDKRLESALFYH